MQAFKQVLPAGPNDLEPDPRSHEGYHWLYVLNGRPRLVLGDRDLVLTAGEVAASILGPQGERFHGRARYRRC